MKKTTFLFLIISVVLFNPVRSQSISDLLNGYDVYNRFGGNVLIAQNGKIIFQQGYGFTDKGRKINTLSNLASVAKTMTATSIIKLNDEGKLSLNDRLDVNFSFVDEITENIIKIMHDKTVTYIPVPMGRSDKKHIGNYRLDDKYGGYNDFRVKYDKKEQSFNFNDDKVSFTAFKAR